METSPGMQSEIRKITFGGTTRPTEKVCRLVAEFLQCLPLSRLVHFLSQEGDGLHHLIVSLSARRGLREMSDPNCFSF